MSEKPLSIRHEMVKSAKWGTVATMFRQGTMAASVLVLSRFLAPSDYGNAAVAGSCTTLFVMLTQFGFSQAIVGLKIVSRRLSYTLLWASMLLATALYIVLASASYPLALFYHKPILAALLPVTGLGLFLSLGSSIPLALLQRALAYRSQAIIAITSATVTLALAIPLALLGSGVWALVLPSLGGSLTEVLLAYHFSGFRPRWAFDGKKLRCALNFGVSAFVSNMANFFCNNSVPLVLGRTWSTSQLGYYSFADNTYARPFDLIAGQLTGALFPVLSKVSGDLARMKKAFLRLAWLSLHLIAPLYIGLIFWARPLFMTVFSPQWQPAIPVFQILCVSCLSRILSAGVGAVLYALRLPHLAARIAFGRAISYAIVLAYCWRSGFGIESTAVAIVATETVIILVYLATCMRHLQCSVSDYVSALRWPLLSSALLSAVFVASRCWKPSQTLWMMTLISLVAAGVYLLPSFGHLAEEWKLISGVLRKEVSLS